MQADGKILMAGTAYNDGTNLDFALVRYKSNGTLDTSFDGDGKVYTDFSNTWDDGYSITLQSDGKILVAGSSRNAYVSPTHTDFAMARYNSEDGSLDTSFDGDGKLTTNFFGLVSNDTGYSVTLQADGKILVAGTSTSGNKGIFALARYNPDGSLDANFHDASTLNAVVSYSENAAPVVLDSSVQIFDDQLASQDNYNGASITLARHGGANSQDVFSGSGVLSFSGSYRANN